MIFPPVAVLFLPPFSFFFGSGLQGFFAVWKTVFIVFFLQISIIKTMLKSSWNEGFTFLTLFIFLSHFFAQSFRFLWS